MENTAIKQDLMGSELPQEVVLRVSNLKKYFPVGKTFFKKNRRVVKAIDDVSFTVNKGEVVGLVGESGSGKTTIGRMIMRLIDPTSGSMEFGETDVATAEGKELMAMRKAIQIIFQDPYGSLNPRMKVGPIIREGLDVHRMYSMAERNERIAKLLETVGLGAAHVNRHPHEFSGGQRQRIGIARALAVSPRLLVADEPVSALDVSVQAQVLNLLQDLKEEYNFSMLMISHDLGVVEHACDKVIVLYLAKSWKWRQPTSSIPIRPIRTLNHFFQRCRFPTRVAAMTRAASFSRGTFPARSAPHPAACSVPAALSLPRSVPRSYRRWKRRVQGISRPAYIADFSRNEMNGSSDNDNNRCIIPATTL
ncbi:ATP-binding cassette domain-containing protein [Halomonas sp. BC04]|uniref:ATP-binding cassette domain-containing protein n=1 Tax=Halomonas sp. BC04 TaxID=1403540 RepID=UPI0004ADA05C